MLRDRRDVPPQGLNLDELSRVLLGAGTLVSNCPPRESFHTLQVPRNPMPQLHLQNFVGGSYVQALGHHRSNLTNPATGEGYGSAPVSRSADIDLAYESAAKAFETWGSTTPAQRQEALLRIADAIEARAEELAEAESRNTGKLVPLLLSEEIPPMLDQIRFFAGAARVLEGRSAGEYLPGHTSWIRREPVGVVGQVAPWNYPMMMAVWKFAPALA